jgi:hypothetical protein
MAFYFDPKNPDFENILVVDDNKVLMTSTERLNELAKAGYLFEACTAQSAMLEGVCLHFLILFKHLEGKALPKNRKSTSKLSELTFGGIKTALLETDLLDKTVANELTLHVQERNRLVHHMTSRIVVVDLEQFYLRGDRLLRHLWPSLARKVQERLQDVDS